MKTIGPNPDMIQVLFDSIAPDYDRLNHLLSLGVDRSWRRRALPRIVTPDRPQQILDLACGTGDFCIAIARKAHPETKVTGLDLSAEMLRVMGDKVRKARLQERIVSIQGNGECIPYADGTFDCVTIAFGIRNFEHREEALREIARVLRPGGSLVILELSMPTNGLLRACYNLYFDRLLPCIGGRISGNSAAYRYLPASVQNFPGKEEWVETMRQCGYSQVLHKSFTFGICRMYVGKKY